ncbi:hypothetical protein QQF73_13790 [Marinobacter sp. M216]|uniref:Nucleotide modification associated domain-containing protein n=1 Tax=Marinobacter albus TaxID=3030833 RepID=A0ABT7HF92_9GAMM|nr:hypothetical protein [Marinobacter sp. M216]MDK9558702.1 hypothetical protein [Marinobacter sp. M216]
MVWRVLDDNGGSIGQSIVFYDSIWRPSPVHAFMVTPMRLILSRKGFDSSAGGCPSPVLPDSSLCVLPIPDDQSRIRYDEVRFGERRLGKLVRDLSGGRVRGGDGAHLDPDLIADAYPRQGGWRPVLGQTGSAQGHLRNQGVAPGDLFLFFAVFRQAELWRRRWRFVPGSRPFHAIWGWLHIADIHSIDALPENALPWARYHPHFHGQPDAGNTLYVASNEFRLPEQRQVLPGSGVFTRFDERLLLSDPDARLPTQWRLPAGFYPGAARVPLSYHARADRWQLAPPWCYLKGAARGQEFVLDLAAYPELEPWLAALVRTARGDPPPP